MGSLSDDISVGKYHRAALAPVSLFSDIWPSQITRVLSLRLSFLMSSYVGFAMLGKYELLRGPRSEMLKLRYLHSRRPDKVLP